MLSGEPRDRPCYIGRIFFRTRQEGLSYGCCLILDVGDEHSVLGSVGFTCSFEGGANNVVCSALKREN